MVAIESFDGRTKVYICMDLEKDFLEIFLRFSRFSGILFLHLLICNLGNCFDFILFPGSALGGNMKTKFETVP